MSHEVIEPKKLVPLEGLGPVRAHIEVACSSAGGDLALVGWLFDPENRVRGLSILLPEQGGLLKKTTYRQRPLEHEDGNVQWIRTLRPDVTQALASAGQAPDDRHGLVLVVPNFPAEGRLALAFHDGQFAVLTFAALTAPEEIRRALTNCWAHSGAALRAALQKALGDDNPLTKLSAELEEKGQALSGKSAEVPKTSPAERENPPRFCIEGALSLNQGLVLIGWATAGAEGALHVISASGDQDWRSEAVMPDAAKGMKLVRTFRPDLRSAIPTAAFGDGLRGFVLYWPLEAKPLGTISISFDGNPAAQEGLRVCQADKDAYALLFPMWIHSGNALKEISAQLKEEKSFASLLEELEAEKISQVSHPFSTCDHALLLNNRALILNGWIAKPAGEAVRIDLVAGRTSRDISSRIKRYPRPDLVPAYPWSSAETLGFLAVLDDPSVLSCDIRLKISCDNGQVQVIRPSVQIMDWPALGEYLKHDSTLAEPLLALLAEAAGLEDKPDRLRERISWLRRGNFLARHPQLPTMVDRPETAIAAIERAFPLGEAGLLIFGWQLTPKRKPLSTTVRTAEGRVADITGCLSPLMRMDMAQKYRASFPEVDDWCGFVCLAPVPTRVGEARVLCFDFGELGEVWLKVPTSTDPKTGERFVRELLELLPAAQYRKLLGEIGKSLGQEQLFESCITGQEDERIAQDVGSSLLACDQALVLNGRALLLHGWIGLERDMLERIELVSGREALDITKNIRRTMRPDLEGHLAWAMNSPPGFLSLVEDPQLIGQTLKLRVTGSDGKRQMITISPQHIDWYGLAEFVKGNLLLTEPLLALLAGAAGLEDDAVRLRERIAWLRRESFLARHAKLPSFVEHSETTIAAMDRGYPLGEAGLLIFGWRLTPKREPLSVTVSGPEGEIVDITGRMSALVRLDVAQNYRKRFPQVSEWSGFVCLVPLPTSPGEARAIRFDFGDAGESWIKIPTDRSEKTGVELIKEILSGIPAPDKLRGVMFQIYSDGLGKAIEAVSNSFPRFSGVIEERQFGRPPERPGVSVIVPLYGRYDFLRYQLAQFVDDRDFDEADLIYVVDDPDILARTMDLAAGYYQLFEKPFRIVYYNQNLGFAGANNAGVRVSRAETILLLNSDIIPKQTGWLSRLRHALDTLPQAGAVGPLLLFSDDSIQHAGMRPKTDPYLPGFSLNTHPGKGQVWKGPDEPSEHPLLTAACLMLKKKDYLELGGLDEGYIIGDFEDSDLCLALRKQGKRLWLVPEAKLWHLERQSQNLESIAGYRQLLTLYNGWRYQRKIQSGVIADPELDKPER